jgi:putative redox protein
VVTDAHGQGFMPADLLLAAVVGCAGGDLVTILEKKKLKLTAIEVKATKENAPEPPWFIKRINLEWTVRGRGLKQKAVADSVHLVEEKYCSVAASLKSEIVTTVRVVNEEEA